MKQQHNIQLEFDGKPEEVKKHLQFLLKELEAIGVEALVDTYKSNKMVRNQVKSKVEKFKKKKGEKKTSVFDKLPI